MAIFELCKSPHFVEQIWKIERLPARELRIARKIGARAPQGISSCARHQGLESSVLGILNVTGFAVGGIFGNVIRNGNSSRQPEIGLETMDSSVAQVSDIFWTMH